MKTNKQNFEKGTLNSYCTIKEAVQISRGVAEDVVSDYQKSLNTLQVSISLQLEILKELVIKADLISEEEFKSLYIEKAEEFKKMQEAYLNYEEPKDSGVKMSANVNSIEVVKE